jgi:tetratricopeptide (TPR) repeat protein
MPRDTVYRTPQQQIRQQRQAGRHNQRFFGIKPPKLHDLVDQVDDHGSDKNLGDVLPTLAQKFLALRRIGQDGPGVRLAPLASVTHPSANRKENRHARLENQPKRHRSADSADQIGPNTSTEIALNIPAAEHARLIPARPVDPAAYNAYLHGRYFWNQRTASALHTALGHFAESVARDPNHAPSHAGIADCYAVLSLIELGALAPSEGMPKARAAARRAFEIDPRLAEAHASLGLVQLWFDWDWAGAEQSFKKAVGLNPGYAPAHQWYSSLLASGGRLEDAMVEVGRALELDPLSLVVRAELAGSLYFERQYDRAIEESAKALELDSRFVLTYFNLGRAYTQKKMHAKALAALHRAYELSDASAVVAMQLGYAYAMAGKKVEARRMLDSLAKLARKGYVPAFYSAAIHTGLRDQERAFAALKQAYEERCDYLVHLGKEPAADALRGDPRFDQIVPRPQPKPSATA